MFTLADLTTAKANLDAAVRRHDGYDGNNPNKHRAGLADALADLHRIEEYLKTVGLLPRSVEEQLWAELDEHFPNAQSRDVVEFRGNRYRRRFSPVSKSLSGKTVKAWDRSWELAGPK
jgi:hypothetical protein